MSALAVALFLASASVAQAQEFTLDVTGSGRHTTLTIGGVIPLDGDVRLDDGAEGQRLEETWQVWENHASAKPVELLAKEVWLKGRLSAANPAVRKPRM